MSLASEYQRRFAWRDWNTILAALPALQGRSVLDLGCGVGDLATEFVAPRFTFNGPADPEVLDAWRTRFQRMRLLREFCGAEIEAVEQAFLCCLASVEHRSAARVHCCVARKRLQDLTPAA